MIYNFVIITRLMLKNSTGGYKDKSDYSFDGSKQYQKALGEINKLININMRNRRQIQEYKQAYENLEQTVTMLKEKTINMKKDKIALWERIEKLEQQIVQLGGRDKLPSGERKKIASRNRANSIPHDELSQSMKLKKSISNNSSVEDSPFISEQKTMLLNLQKRVIMQGHTIIQLEEELKAKKQEISMIMEANSKSQIPSTSLKKILPLFSQSPKEQSTRLIPFTFEQQASSGMQQGRSRSQTKLQKPRQTCKACEKLNEQIRLAKQWSEALHNQNIYLKKQLVVYNYSVISGPESFLQRANLPTNLNEKQAEMIQNLRQQLRQLNKKSKKDNILHKKLLLQQSDEINNLKQDKEQLFQKIQKLEDQIINLGKSSRKQFNSSDSD